MTADERKRALTLIWRHTHADYKSTLDDDTKTIMVYRAGSCTVALDDLTDAEIANRLPYCQKLEARRQLKLRSGRDA